MPAARDFRTPVRALVRGGPVVLPALLAAAVFAFLAFHEAGFNPSDWYGAALLVLALLVLAVVAVPAAGRPPRVVLAAAALLAGYALWSYASIAWAQQNADAWDGANRTALYACVFALFALWPLGRRGATLLVGLLALVTVVVALHSLLGADPARELDFVGGRLARPTYPNGTVALWFLAFWPCVMFGSRRELHPVLRGLFLAGAVVLAGTTLLSQSRGWLFSMPIVTVIFLAISPARVRTAWTLAATAAVTVLIAPTVLDVFAAFGDGKPASGPLASAQRAILIAALLFGVAGAGAAYLDRRVRVPAETGRRIGQAMLAAAALALVAGSIAFVAARGNPVTWVGDRWSEFKSAPEPTTTKARFTQTLGSNRYDFWRVAWGRFEAHPITGIGADNFREDYLLRRHSLEEPYYPHSIVLRTLAQTGLVGVLLLGGALGCALVAAGRAIRRRGGLAAATAAAATTSFAYFAVHGSVDWFWELPALGCLAFASLGIAAGLVPRPALPPRSRRGREPLARDPRALAALAVGAGLLAASFAAPWLAVRQTDSARSYFKGDPAQAKVALERLDSAAALNPFEPRPRILAAKIQIAVGRLDLAARDFRAALDRDPRYANADLLLASVLSMRGDRAGAERATAHAAGLSPRDPLAQDLLKTLRGGGRLDYYDVNARLQSRARDRVR